MLLCRIMFGLFTHSFLFPGPGMCQKKFALLAVAQIHSETSAKYIKRQFFMCKLSKPKKKLSS